MTARLQVRQNTVNERTAICCALRNESERNPTGRETAAVQLLPTRSDTAWRCRAGRQVATVTVMTTRRDHDQQGTCPPRSEFDCRDLPAAPGAQMGPIPRYSALVDHDARPRTTDSLSVNRHLLAGCGSPRRRNRFEDSFYCVVRTRIPTIHYQESRTLSGGAVLGQGCRKPWCNSFDEP